MALSVETGIFNADTADAVTTVSSSFQGKGIIMWTTGQTAEGVDDAANAMWSFGFSDGTNHRCTAWASDDNVATTNCGCTFRTDSAIEILSDGTPTSVRRITGVSFGASSFDLTWDGTPAAAYKVAYMLLGGTDITNVLVGTHTLDTALGADGVTGLAFQPDFGIFINSQKTAAGTGTRALCAMGFATTSAKEFTTFIGIDDAANMTTTIDAVSYTNAAACMSGVTAGAETVNFLADFTSFNSDGYTINISNAPPAAWLVGYFLVKGGQWDVGTTTPVAGGTRTISGMAFQPKGVFVTSCSATADATVTIHAKSAAGAATSTSTEATVTAYQSDAVLNTAVNRDTSSTLLLLGASPGTSFGDNDFSQFTSDGWEFTNNGASTMPQLGWFACGDSPVAPTTTGEGWWGGKGIGRW